MSRSTEFWIPRRRRIGSTAAGEAVIRSAKVPGFRMERGGRDLGRPPKVGEALGLLTK